MCVHVCTLQIYAFSARSGAWDVSIKKRISNEHNFLEIHQAQPWVQKGKYMYKIHLIVLGHDAV